jgi:hypothetical protein
MFEMVTIFNLASHFNKCEDKNFYSKSTITKVLETQSGISIGFLFDALLHIKCLTTVT